ncbi:signal peptidase II [Candidatus Pelagibacter sp.]|uniref:signal peptidase II n=1 Tax=Candidatus Pelagibacter sp. TaxID=2024849 RepID=UPI003F82BA02
MIEKILRKSFIISLLLVFSIFLLDRLSKIYVIYLDKKFLGSELLSSKFLNIRLIWNDGIAFGLLSFNEKIFYNALTFLILIIILIIFFMLSKSNGIKKFSLMMILGGAIGNVYDRIFYGAVPDFIDFHIGNFHWFIFNVADIFITLGVIFMIIIEITGNNKNNKYEIL